MMKNYMTLLLAASFVLCGCAAQNKDDPPAENIPEYVMQQIEGNYETVASLYPEAQQYDIGYDAFQIRNGVLSGYLFQEGRWEDIGTLEKVSVSDKMAEQVFQNARISADYAIDLPAEFKHMEYRTVTGNREYYLALPLSESAQRMACVRDGEIEWMKQILKRDELHSTDSYDARITEEALPHTLDINIFDRTYLLEIPSANEVSEGTFRFENRVMILQDSTDSTELRLTPEEHGYRDQKTNAYFRPTGWKMLRGMYGTADMDLDGDGKKETIWLGDQGLSGPLGLTIAIDSQGTDVFRMYYAEHGQVSLIEENGRLYISLICTPWQGEPVEGRFEIHYDGSTVWITDAENNIVEDNISVTEAA